MRRRSKLSLVLVMGLVGAGAVGCGVKGKPLPPLEPAEIGRGAPTYKRAAEQAKPTTVPDSDFTRPTATPSRRGP